MSCTSVRMWNAVLGLVCGTLTSVVHASGFTLIEDGASGQGNAFAGAAAVAEDATTIFFNPAGMTRLSSRQNVVAGHLISTTADFKNQASAQRTHKVSEHIFCLSI
jgi:long-chain fatty acid transport protein